MNTHGLLPAHPPPTVPTAYREMIIILIIASNSSDDSALVAFVWPGLKVETFTRSTFRQLYTKTKTDTGCQSTIKVWQSPSSRGRDERLDSFLKTI